MKRRNKKRSIYREIGKFASLGLEMALSVVIGLIVGALLDKKLNTYPWLTLLFLLFGFAAGFRSLLRAARKAAKEEEEENSSGRQS